MRRFGGFFGRWLGSEEDAGTDQGKAAPLPSIQAITEKNKTQYQHKRRIKIAQNTHAASTELVECAKIQGVGQANAD